MIRGSITAQRYVQDILQPHVLPLMAGFPKCLFHQDNARPHTARMSRECLRNVVTLPRPARSTELSPIEHVWDHLGRQLQRPRNLQDIENQLRQIWTDMPQDTIRNLYASIPARITPCIQTRGGQTGYKSLKSGAFSRFCESRILTVSNHSTIFSSSTLPSFHHHLPFFPPFRACPGVESAEGRLHPVICGQYCTPTTRNSPGNETERGDAVNE
ncbi:hypothetical protein ANN_19609 [Periplaneta americana]|uniref:Uncharacterized protein n=1 Tax=Periplaneta americana TaxID=6978 RepID=A0ABQ8SBH0_PERAM|nr:hypothetical protein ANN_19609 [Periplaneta americana]